MRIVRGLSHHPVQSQHLGTDGHPKSQPIHRIYATDLPKRKTCHVGKLDITAWMAANPEIRQPGDRTNFVSENHLMTTK